MYGVIYKEKVPIYFRSSHKSTFTTGVVLLAGRQVVESIKAKVDPTILLTPSKSYLMYALLHFLYKPLQFLTFCFRSFFFLLQVSNGSCGGSWATLGYTKILETM